MSKLLSRKRPRTLTLVGRALLATTSLLLAPALWAEPEPDLLGAAANPADWLSYGHGYANQRYSPARQITRDNVSRLVPKWIYQTGLVGTFQTSPIVSKGVVYLTTPNNHLVALDGISGEPLWRYRHQMATQDLCCGTHNRGAAIGDGRLYEITADGRLIAVDQHDGHLIWDMPIVDPASGAADAPQQVRNMDRLPAQETARWTRYMGNMAPLFYDGLVIVGTSGAGYTRALNDVDEQGLTAVGRPGKREGLRAFISAYEADSGRLAWRWYSTKDQGWEGRYTPSTSMGDALDRDLPAERAMAERYRDAWKRGGGSISGSPSLDPALGLIYFGTGNPAPYADLYRPGDNLYTASLIALEAKTGQLRWFHQITPHDIWGYDLASPPVLIDVLQNGKTVPGLGLATKSGWVYFFNRITGALIRRSEGFVPQTNLFKRPRDAKGIIAVPGEAGGANWAPSSYSPDTGWFYVAGTHYPSRFSLELDDQGHAVNMLSFSKDVPRYGTINAIDPATGKLAWQQRSAAPFSGGITTTAGGLALLGESDGYFQARDSRSGALLWRFQTGAGVNAPPVVYEAGGREYIIVAAGGNTLFNSAPGDTVIAFGLADSPP
jgi:glucose dehydrogenase